MTKPLTPGEALDAVLAGKRLVSCGTCTLQKIGGVPTFHSKSCGTDGARASLETLLSYNWSIAPLTDEELAARWEMDARLFAANNPSSDDRRAASVLRACASELLARGGK